MTFADQAPLGRTTQSGAPLVLSGRDAILRAQPRLQRYAAEWGQAGAADHIDYFLTQPYTGGKRPHLLLFEAGGSAGDGRSLEGAVLVHEYCFLGMPLGVFVTEDDGGERNILGPPGARGELAARAAGYLLRDRRAHLVLLSFQEPGFSMPPAERTTAHPRWAFRQRMLRRRLPLLGSYTATLDTLGAHTRRNFRLYRRRALRDYDCSFLPRADLDEQDFIALNARCDYPVPPRVAQWRYRSAHAVAGGVLAGVRTGSGEWISMLGGRRCHGTFSIDWQMNRGDFARVSPATLMRGFVMEHEGVAGTRSLLFQGGTTHTMQSAFQPEQVVDLVGSSASLPATLLCRLAGLVSKPENFLLRTLADRDLQWQPGAGA